MNARRTPPSSRQVPARKPARRKAKPKESTDHGSGGFLTSLWKAFREGAKQNQKERKRR
jgi:hypothetical protein